MLRLAHKFAEKRASWFGRGCDPQTARVASFFGGFVKDIIASDAPVIVADNVSELYWTSQQLVWEQHDFPNVTPPFSRMFIEWLVPEFGKTIEGNETRLADSGSRLFGCGIVSIDKFKATTPIESISDLLGSVNADFGVLSEDKNAKKIVDECRWLVFATLCTTQFGQPCVIPARILYCVGGQGEWLGSMVIADQQFLNHLKMITNGHPVSEVNFLNLLHVPFLAVSFMHCKNVALTDGTKSVAPSEKWLRRQGQMPIKYHVLDINPMKEVLRNEGNIGENGIKKALHICRGHFKHYNGKVGPFGRHIDEPMTFWCPSHVKGDIKHGAVIKDYEVKTNG